MSEILRKFLEYVGFNDYEIENMDDVEIHFHSESREFKYFSDGYEACQKDLLSWTDREQLTKENAELKEKYEALELNTGTRIKGCNDEIYRLKEKLLEISNWIRNIDFSNYQHCVDKIKELAE